MTFSSGEVKTMRDLWISLPPTKVKNISHGALGADAYGTSYFLKDGLSSVKNTES